MNYNEYLESGFTLDEIPNNYKISFNGYRFLIPSGRYNPYIIKIPNTNPIKYLLSTLNNLDYLYDILLNKFKNWKLKYNTQVFTDLVYSLVYSNIMSLNAIAKIIEKTNTAFEQDNWKNIVEVQTSSNSVDTESYIGYNVKGDYQTTNGDNSVNSTQKSYNPIQSMNLIYNSEWAVAFEDFINQFKKLFVMYSIPNFRG